MCAAACKALGRPYGTEANDGWPGGCYDSQQNSDSKCWWNKASGMSDLHTRRVCAGTKNLGDSVASSNVTQACKPTQGVFVLMLDLRRSRL